MLSQIYIRKTKVVLSLLEIATVVKDIKAKFFNCVCNI